MMAKQILDEEEHQRDQNLLDSDSSGNLKIEMSQNQQIGNESLAAKWNRKSEDCMRSIQIFYESHRRLLIFLFFFVLFWKIILITLWILL